MSTLSTSSSQNDAAKLKLEGNKLFKAKKYKAAAEKFRGAIEKHPSCSIYYTNLCACLNHLKLYEEMQIIASRGIGVDADSIKGHYWLIMSLKKQKKFKDAFRQSEISLQRFPDNSELRLLQSDVGAHLERCAYTDCPTVTSVHEKDLLKCSACKGTYYCSRDCQKNDWFRHKMTCLHNNKISGCTTCNRNFPNKEIIRCKDCNKETYCSIDCLEKGKLRHQPICQVGMSEEMELFHKWLESSSSECLAYLASHAMTKKQYLNMNPDFYIDIEVRFSEQYCAFAPSRPPKLVYFSEADAEDATVMKEGLASFKDLVGPFQVSHVLVISSEVNGRVVSRKRYQILTAENYQMLPRDKAMSSAFDQVNNLRNPLLPPKWKPLFHERVGLQLGEWVGSEELHDFAVSSYRLESKSTLKSPHKYTLVIKIEFGENLGEVKRIVSYSMKKISDLKDLDLVKRARDLLNEELEKKTNQVLTLTILSNNLTNSPFAIVIPMLHIPFPHVQDSTLKEKDIDKEIRKRWKSLVKVPFPKCPPTPKYPRP
ncbi:hypothetical protein CTEN210_02877 [Chaetoceros tenuissimus]|uniref:MYND-type domain-containing protein n=1 Tax=Chaetoceros tenuissimus TaxID=426638 RepID=A0AAD3CIB6_9STRA|nr:hypothetical protein CTEN210_02877 [Chaetoceros tenuissimus]